MRIPAVKVAPDSASNAPTGARTGSAAAFMGLLSAFDASEFGPEGAASRAHKQLNDPLGLATSEALTSVSQGVQAATESRQGGSAESAATGLPRGGEQSDAGRVGVAHRRPAGPTPHPPDSRRDAGGSEKEERAGVERTQGQARSSGSQTLSGSNTSGRDVPRSTQAQTGSGGRVEAVGTTTGPARAGSLGGKAMPGVQPSLAKPETSARGAKTSPHESILRQEKAEIAPQIAKGLASLLLRKGGSMQIQLRPEALGRVQVDLTIEDGVVHATMNAEHEQARQLLSSELDRLRMMLEHRGLRVERLEIAPAHDEPEARGQQDAHRGGWRTPAEDEHRGVGTEADNRSPGGGDHERAWGGDPHGRAERRRPDGQASAAEADAVPIDSLIDPYTRRSPVMVSIRLDTVA